MPAVWNSISRYTAINSIPPAKIHVPPIHKYDRVESIPTQHSHTHTLSLTDTSKFTTLNDIHKSTLSHYILHYVHICRSGTHVNVDMALISFLQGQYVEWWCIVQNGISITSCVCVQAPGGATDW